MGNDALWLLWILTVALWGVGIGGLALNGVTQIATGRPGFLPFERWIRKRRPAANHDFVLRGAAEVLQAFGLTLIAAPMSFMGLLSTTALTTGWHLPSPPQIPIFVGVVVFGAYMGSLVLGAVCVVSAYIISNRVNYLPVDTELGAAS